MHTTPLVSEVMSKSPRVVHPDTSLAECARRMLRERVGSLLVQENGVLKGILTEKDFVSATHAGLPMASTKAREVMEYVVITITPEKNIVDAMKIMAKYGVRRLPVINDEQKLVGLITMKDILEVQPHLFEMFLVQKQEERKATVPQDGECEQCGAFTLVQYGEGGWVCEDCRE